MLDHDFWSRRGREIKNLLPLFRYLILQTETHAFCLAVAAAALLGFFPSCLVMLAVLKNLLNWNAAYDAMLATVRYLPSPDPTDLDFVIRNLRANAAALGRGIGLSYLLWVLLGAAGVFIPLEAALNRLWQVQQDRPYWKNQIAGFTLTVACTFAGLLLIMISTPLHAAVTRLFQTSPMGTFLRQVIVDATTTCFFIVAIFALYKYLPNKKIDAKQVLPAAILAGVIAELVRTIYAHTVPNLVPTQGPFAISVTFMLFAYFETFVVLGCAFLATETERYPWMGFLKRKGNEPSPS